MPATGQNSLSNFAASEAGCPQTKDLINADFFGSWVLELQSSAGVLSTVRLSLVRNPEFSESLTGHFLQGNIRHEVFGDIENGALDFEESHNGQDIIAIWKGTVSAGSCGKAMMGTRHGVGSQAATQGEQAFVLRRAGW